MKRKQIVLISCAIAVITAWLLVPSNNKESTPLLYQVKPNSFLVEIHTVGELEASRSTMIAPAIHGENTKIIYLVNDGSNVQAGDTLVKIDGSSYENKIAELKSKLNDQKTSIDTLEKSLQWEYEQTAIERKVAQLEIETAELDLNKIVKGDGPLEISKLRSSLQKSLTEYDDLSGYVNELKKLEEEGFVNISEIKQAQKKLGEAKEAYDIDQLQYDNYVNHVYPMLVKKAESQISRAKMKLDENAKAQNFEFLAQSTLEQANHHLKELTQQLKWTEYELSLTEIKAQNPGMVVLKEEFRVGQRRKPRIGDLAVKNQTLLDLPDLTSLIVKSKIREIDLHKIEIGKPASIQIDAYPESIFKGTVIGIGALALSDMHKFGEEKYFEILLSLDQIDSRLRPGMTSRVTIHADDIQNKISIPFQAVFESKNKNYCYIKKFNGFELRELSLGAYNDQWIEVKAGLKLGEHICLSDPKISL